MSEQIDILEVEGGCRNRGCATVSQPSCGQAYYQDWRAAQPCFQPDQRICQPFGQPQIAQPGGCGTVGDARGCAPRGGCGTIGSAGSDGSNTGGYWDNARNSENQNQMQYWGAKQEGNIVRTAQGKVMDVDYGNGNWAHSPHDSNSVTVHRDNRTEHWVSQPDGRWYDQINNRFVQQQDVNYDPSTGKLVIEGQTFDPTKQSGGGPDALPPAPADSTPGPAPAPGVDKPNPPSDTKPPVVPPTDGKPPVVPPTDGKPPVVPPTDTKPPVAPPTDTKPPVAQPTDAKPPVAPPEAPKPYTAEQLVGELAKAPFDVNRLHALMGNMSDKDRLTLVQSAITAAEKSPEGAGKAALVDNAHKLMAAELLPLVVNGNWNLDALKEKMSGLTSVERYKALNDCVKLTDTIAKEFNDGAKFQAIVRGTRGLMCADIGNECAKMADAEKTDQALKTRLSQYAETWRGLAAENFLSAGYLDGDLYKAPQHESFRQGVSNGMPGASGDLILSKGKENNQWFVPAARVAGADADPVGTAYKSALTEIKTAMKQPKVARPAVAPAPKPLETTAPKGYR